MNGIRMSVGTVLVGAVVLGSRCGLAADSVTNKLDELDQKVKALERRLQGTDETAGAKPSDAVVAKAGKDGFSLSSADKAFQLKIRGYVQADGRFYLNDEQDKVSDTFLLRRVRPIFDVTTYSDFAYRFAPDFGGSSPTIQDAYADYLANPAFNVRGGKFKVPFCLEFLQTDCEMFFGERGLPNQLSPNRDVGVEAYGSAVSGAVTYAVGVFDGAADGGNTDTDNNDEKDLAARLFLHPFRVTDLAALQNLGVGMAATLGNERGTAASSSLPTLKTSGQQAFFSYKSSTNANGTAYANGNHVRLSPQAYYYAGPFGLLAEYVRSSQDVADGKNNATLDNTAWQVQAGVVLTGEKASYNDVTPRANFAPSKGTWGAFELVGRYGELTVDNAAFATFADSAKSASAAKTWAIGLNWYLSRSVKLLLDYDQTAFTGGAAKGADQPDEKLLLCRAQFTF